MIDLRSDTVTKPSAAMRRAMADAEVGDDTFGEDPTINRLEEKVAELLGVEAALYVSSGQLGNQLSLRIHGRGGDCVIAHEYSHIFEYETGAPSAISGLASRFIRTPDGTFTTADLKPLLRPQDIHHSRDRILSIENTHNRCGGVVWDLEQYNSVCRFAHERGMAVHLDGARIWNACAAGRTTLSDWTENVDSVSVCFSKGLGAPVGSAVCGSRELVAEARFYRKMFGGQMRQAGIIAAGALYALEHNLDRVEEDHENARLLAEQISELPGLSCIWPASNILMVEVVSPALLASEIVAELAKEGVLLFDLSEKHMRLVTHLDVTREQCQEAAKRL
jgi:threonine aldolase